VPNAQVTFSFSPERSAVHLRCLPGEPLRSRDATLTIGGGGRVHGASPAAPAPGTPAGTEASSGRGGRVELPSPAPPPPAGSTLPQATAPEAGPEGLAAETFELVNATKGPGGTWYLWWSSPGKWLSAEPEAEGREKQEGALAIPGAGAEPPAAPASSLPALPAGTAGVASPGSAAPESRLEGEVVLVNPLSTGGAWSLQWQANEGEDPGVAFSEGGSALPIRTIGKGRKTREILIPPGHRATLRPSGGRACRRIRLGAVRRGSVRNPFRASLAPTFIGADSRIAVNYRSKGPSRPPYRIAGNVLTLTGPGWGEPPAGRKRKASYGPTPDAPAPAAAGTPVAVRGPKLKGPGTRPRLEADPPPASSPLPPPAPPTEGTAPAPPR